MITDRLKIWVRAIRVPFFTATIIPVSLGAILSWYDTSIFHWFKFCLTMIGAIFIHAGTNLANDYFDHVSGCDESNPNPTPFSGGSRVIQEGLILPKKILAAFTIFFVLGSIIGIYLNFVAKGNVILILGIIGVFLGLFYSAKPFRIGYGSFGELAVGIGFGPLLVLGAYYVQAEALTNNSFLISIPIGILIALVLYINEFPDYVADKKVNKMTLVVFLGKKRAVILYHMLLALTYLLIVSFVVFKVLPPLSLITFLTLPLALKIIMTSKRNYDKIYELLPANAGTIGLHALIGILLCVSILLDKLL